MWSSLERNGHWSISQVREIKVQMSLTQDIDVPLGVGVPKLVAGITLDHHEVIVQSCTCLAGIFKGEGFMIFRHFQPGICMLYQKDKERLCGFLLQALYQSLL